MRDLSDPKTGVKVNWTLARAGIVFNMIPPGAQATADVRVARIADDDGIEAQLRERVKKKAPARFARRARLRAPLPAARAPASRALSAHAQTIYRSSARSVVDSAGGFTDAANASLKTNAPVIEGFGLHGFGAHTTNAEYVLTGRSSRGSTSPRAW